MKKIKNTRCNISRLIYLTKFYLFNKDVGSLNFFFMHLKNIAQEKKNQGYIYSLFPALQVSNETYSSISSNSLISLGIVLGSVLFCGFKFLFKNQPINQPINQVEIVSQIIPVPQEQTALQFIANNFQTLDFNVFPYYNLKPLVYINYNKNLELIQPTLYGKPVTITFENAHIFIKLYTFKINSFISLLDTATIFWTVFGGVPWHVLVLLGVFQAYKPITFLKLCTRYIAKVLLWLREDATWFKFIRLKTIEVPKNILHLISKGKL